jgi:hypothetical protein
MAHIVQAERLSSEVRAFCTLLARILSRGMAERDPRLLSALGLPAPAPGSRKGGPNESPA